LDGSSSLTPTTNTLLEPTAQQPLVLDPKDNSDTTLLQALLTHLNKKLDPITTCLAALEDQTGNSLHGAYNAYDGADVGMNVLYDYTDYDKQMQANTMTLLKATNPQMMSVPRIGMLQHAESHTLPTWPPMASTPKMKCTTKWSKTLRRSSLIS